MVSFLLVILNAGALCVARTDICAPANSIMTGTIDQQGGRVTITPATPMKALGAEFRADAPLTVDVLPWRSSDKSSGAIVHVRGELSRESVISGAAVAGVVRIGQQQGRKGSPQLVEATDFRRGKLQVFTAGTITVAPGMRLQGGVESGGGRIEITSQQAVHGLGLDFDAGVIRVEQGATAPTISGTLARAQDIGGVLVEGWVSATIEPGHPKFRAATLARPTPLALLGLPAGEAPAGTVLAIAPSATTLSGPGPFTVCGITIAPTKTLTRPAVTFEITPQAPGLTMHAALVGTDVDVGNGVHMTGPISIGYDAASCTIHALDGTLARDAVLERLSFARRTTIAMGARGKDRFVRGTLDRASIVDGLTLTGATMISATSAGEVHVVDGILAKAAPFEQWNLPVGTHVQRFGVDTWSFEVPRGKSARAIAEHRGERVDLVTQADSDGTSTMFKLARPHQPKGTQLAFQSLGIDHLTGCVLGNVSAPQRFGIFRIPAGGNATVCGGTIVAAEGPYAIPALQVGSWFATTAFAAPAGFPSPKDAAPAPTTAPAGPFVGYWVQINSLCRGASGKPQPPPPRWWIWVDLKGQATRDPDRLVLAKNAAKAGKPCPVTPCCVP